MGTEKIEEKNDAVLTEEDEKRKNLIIRNLQEVLGLEKLVKQIHVGKNIHVYWGTATTGRPHVGYFVPMRKIADFLHAGLKVTILFADLHAFLDNMKSTWELLENRVIYYENVLKALLTAFNVPIDKLHFVKGTTYQLTREYTSDILRLSSQVSRRDALRAGAEVVKQVASPLLSGLLYPLCQAVDEQHLKVDGEFGGVDQRKIFILAEEQLPKVKLGKRFHLMNPMVPGLQGSKMSSSEEGSKIDLLDPPKVVAAKIDGALCIRNSEDNGVLAFYDYVLFPIVHPNAVVVAEKSYTCCEDLKRDFNEGRIKQTELKSTLKKFLCEILYDVQKRCDTEEIRFAIEKGYADSKIMDSVFLLNERDIPVLNDEQSKRFSDIVRNAEVIEDIHLKAKIAIGSSLNILYCLAPKGRFHLGFVLPLLKIREIQKIQQDVNIKIVIADVEAFLDNEKCPWTVRDARCTYYESMLKQLISQLDLKNVSIIRGSNHQLEPDYTLEMYKLASKVTRDEAALLEGVSLATLLAPLYFTIEQYHLDADLVVMGDDMREFAHLAAKMTKRHGKYTRTQLLVPTLPSMSGKVMSASDPEFHLDPCDTPKQTRQKIARSFCEPGNVKGNIALQLAKLFVFPLIEKELEILRSEENGGNISVVNYENLEDLFASEQLHPGDLKSAVVGAVNSFFDSIRSISGLQKTLSAAFPTVKGAKKSQQPKK